MPRDIPVGNGQMLVTFDRSYRIRDLYFPHVGQENHAGGGPCRFGVWSPIPRTAFNQGDRRQQRLFWSDAGWQIDLGYQDRVVATDVRMQHEQLQLELRCVDVVDFHRPLLVRRIEIINRVDEDRQIHLFHHNDFLMYGSKVGDTAYFDPKLRCLIHYRKSRYLMTCWHADGETRIDQYATGTAGFNGAEGTWRDAEDGVLGNNSIAQGAVDSTMMLQVSLGPRGTPAGTRIAYLVIGAGHAWRDLQDLQHFLHRHTPQGVIDRTVAYWRQWLGATRTALPDEQECGLSKPVARLFERSLLVLRTQIDNSGAIIAANDSDIMQYSRDTYSYLWPRDGALVASAMDDAGFPDVAKSFYALCARIITDHGCFLHKYNPDGSLASSWHPWVSIGNPQLPIQEDETALVIWALWRHYERYGDIEFVRPLWAQLITPAADFLLRFRDPSTHLPLPSYDLWEERWGVHAFTVATVFGGLVAAHRFADCFGDLRRARTYFEAAQEVRQAFCTHLWSEPHQRFLRRIVPLDHDRTARLMSQILAGRSPQAHPADGLGPGPAPGGNGQGGPEMGLRCEPGDPKDAAPETLQFEHDPVIDSSMYAIFAMGMLQPDDARVVKTMEAIQERLWVRTPVGGIARYESDTYHHVTNDTAAVPGNPWFICTLWLAKWYIAKAGNMEQLRQALPLLEWTSEHALPSGVLAEQVDPLDNSPLSVSPLTWSHGTVVSTVLAYLTKFDRMQSCSTCGQPRIWRSRQERAMAGAARGE